MKVAIEYPFAGGADAFAEAGATEAKVQAGYTVMQCVEPVLGKPDWRALDELTREWAGAGIRWAQLLLTPEHPDVDPTTPEGRTAFGAYAARMIEHFPDVPHWGIGPELSGFWPWSLDTAIRLADLVEPLLPAGARLSLPGIVALDIFHDGQTAPWVLNGRTRQTPAWRFSWADILRVLAWADADTGRREVDIHLLGDAREISATLATMRPYTRAPFIAGDVMPISLNCGFAGIFGWPPAWAFHPTRWWDVQVFCRRLVDAARGDAQAQAVWEAEVASSLTAKVAALRQGAVELACIGNTEDWWPGGPNLTEAWVRVLGAQPLMGLVECEITAQHAGRPLQGRYRDLSRIRRPTRRRPGWYALRDALGGAAHTAAAAL